MATVEKWYVLNDDGQTTGPISTNVLAERVEKGDISKEVLCWCDGRDTWQSAESIAELQAAFGVAESKNINQQKIENSQISVFEKAIARLDHKEEEEEEEGKEESFVDDDGTRYKWNHELHKYEPQEVRTYDQQTMTFGGIDEKTPSLEDSLKKEEAHSNDDKKRKDTEEPHWSDPKKTTSVYVTGLPIDVTTEEVAKVFSKCGILKEDETEGVKIKIYKDKESGIPKGDGLVTYLKRPSVELAINILGGTPFRDSMTQKMTIQEAHFELKGTVRNQKKSARKKKKGHGHGHGHENKALSWGGFDDHLALHQITVILKHMFQPSDFETGEMNEEDLKKDVEKECSKLGEVEKINIYCKHPDGIVSVRFTNAEVVDACVNLMNGRYFAGKQIQAAKWDGFTKYHLHGEKKDSQDEDARLEKFAQDLEKT